MIVIQSERLKHSTSPRNQSAKHPDSGCLRIRGVVIGSALSKRSRSSPEAFRAGHFEDSKPETAHEKPLAPRVAWREKRKALGERQFDIREQEWESAERVRVDGENLSLKCVLVKTTDLNFKRARLHGDRKS